MTPHFQLKKGIAVLPFHDSFIVKNHHRDALEVIMAKAYKVLGFVSVPKLTIVDQVCDLGVTQYIKLL